MDLSFLVSNPLINVAVISWATAQLLKALIDAIKHKQFDRHRLAGAGGMPSSHSALTCSVLLTSYYMYGFNSPVFALSFILAMIVMYDATGVRWAAGLHAKAINHIVEFLEKEDDPEGKRALGELIPKLNEVNMIGSCIVDDEAVCGAALGFVIAIIAHLIRQGGAKLF